MAILNGASGKAVQKRDESVLSERGVLIKAVLEQIADSKKRD